MNRVYSFVKRQFLNVLLVCTYILAFCSVLVIFNNIYFSDTKPPRNIFTINEFKDWKPSFTQTQKVILKENTIFIVQGDYSRFFPSPKSEYYFDQKGNYINWNKDPGDMVTLPIITLGKRLTSNLDEIGK